MFHVCIKCHIWFSIFNLHVSFRLCDLDFAALAFHSDNPKHKKKKKKKKHERKLKGSLERLELHLQKKTREKESYAAGDYLCDQDRNQGSKQLYKEGMPSGAGDSKNHSSVTAKECVKGEGPRDACRTPFLFT